MSILSNDFFFLQEYVDLKFKSSSVIDHEAISNEFLQLLAKDFSDERFENLLIHSGYIPDLYPNDSSEETLFTKLVEALVCEWARRMGYTSQLIKEKSSKEDIKITISGRVIVSDAKSFRLGRSQQAPNAKDFLKLEDIRKWMAWYKNSIGGLVTYPCTHEWKSDSDIYQYCSTKDAPTVMLPYKYMAYLLHQKGHFNPTDLLQLWDYNSLFPEKLTKKEKGGNKVKYWQVINSAILNITNTQGDEFVEYMTRADKIINNCIIAIISKIETTRNAIIKQIKCDISKETDIKKLQTSLMDLQIQTLTEQLDTYITRIKNFRL